MAGGPANASDHVMQCLGVPMGLLHQSHNIMKNLVPLPPVTSVAACLVGTL